MEDVIVISDSEDESLATGLCPTLSRTAQDTDSTSNRCVSSDLSSSIIDLTATEELLQLNSELSPLNNGLRFSDLDETLCSSSSSSSGEKWHPNGEVSDDGTSNGSWRTADSSMSSQENDGNAVLQEKFTSPIKCLTAKTSHTLADSSLTLQGWSPPATSASGRSSPEYAAVFPEVSSEPQPDAVSTLSLPAPEEPADAQLLTINKALVYKLQYFKRPPVNHFFHKTQEMNLHPAPIPHSRMRIVDTPKDENFHQGTLHFLSEFVTAQHYPPKETVKHVIQCILLGVEEQAMKNEAYMILMKVQKLHPATANTVAWDWNLLTEVIGKKRDQTCHLFFQYVLQTLDDDFQIHVQRRSFQKSLCKAMLSCDKCSTNIKNVIDWLIHAVEEACKDVEKLHDHFQLEERMVVLLQRMLSIAVEVDNLPVISSNRIAELLFPKVIVLKTRQQREMFLSNTENFLLRAKILEIIFQNSCESMPSPGLPLSLYKILHFIGNSTLLLENQGPQWQRWDELLHHICLLYFSLQKIITDHLRTPVTDRSDEMLQRPQTHFLLPEDITEADVMYYLNLFWKRTSFGSEAPEALQNRFHMLKSFLLLDVRKWIQ